VNPSLTLGAPVSLAWTVAYIVDKSSAAVQLERDLSRYRLSLIAYRIIYAVSYGIHCSHDCPQAKGRLHGNRDMKEAFGAVPIAILTTGYPLA
jgi:hypothetical protein